MRALHTITYVLGCLLGVLLLPVTLGFLIRNRFARAFHPDGTLYEAKFVELAREGGFLAGPALVRLSATMTRGEAEKPDVIGLVVRFGTNFAGAGVAQVPRDAQDVLTATFDGFRPAQLRRGKQTTNCHDFLDNDYRAIALYVVPGIGLAHLRFTGLRRPAEGGGKGTRAARLDEAIADGDARFVLEVSQGVDAWLALGTLDLTRRLDASQKQLAFSPFRTGRGIRPTGLLNGLRRVNYVLSRFMRGGPMR
jgi:hypothetical protein